MSVNGNSPRVQLGEHDYPLYPQKIGYLENKLGRLVKGMAEQAVDGDTSSVVGWLGERTYDVLKVFVPKLMPLYEFRGYASEQAMEAGDYDEDADKSPDWPQVVTAIEQAMAVNRFDLFKHLGKVVDQETRSALIAAAASRALSGASSATESSTTTPPTTSTDFGTTPPTLTPSAA